MTIFERLCEKVCNKYPKDNDIWRLLQEVIGMKQRICKAEREIEEIKDSIQRKEVAESMDRLRFVNDNRKQVVCVPTDVGAEE